MEDLEEIRRRISKKHHQGKNNKILGDRQFSHLYRFAITTMSLCVLSLGVASYVKEHPKANTFLREHVNFYEVTQWVDAHLLSAIPFFNQESLQEVVNAPLDYVSVGNGLYRSENHIVASIKAGIVTSVQDDSLEISLDNGVVATYENLTEVEVSLYDHVEMGETIGKSENQFKVTFVKNEQKISYEDALALD